MADKTEPLPIKIHQEHNSVCARLGHVSVMFETNNGQPLLYLSDGVNLSKLAGADLDALIAVLIAIRDILPAEQSVRNYVDERGLGVGPT